MQGEGILLSPGGVLDVTSGSQGRLVKFLARTGDTVAVGQTVAEIDQPQLRQDLAVAESELADVAFERKQVLDFQARRAAAASASLAQRRQALTESSTFLTRNLGWNRERAAIQTSLGDKGLAVKEKVLQAQIDVGKIEADLANNTTSLRQLDDEEIKTRVEDQQTLLNIDIRRGAAARKVADIKERLAFESTVSSPYAGRVEEIKVNLGELVERGTALFALVPTDAPVVATPTAGEAVGRLLAVVYVPAASGKQVTPGAPVNLAVSTARKEEYGFVLGRVRSVAAIPSTSEGMQRALKNRQLVQVLSNNGAPFEVVVELYVDPATPSGYKWSSSRGPNLQINDGTLVSGEIETRSLSLLGLLIPPVRSLLAWVSPDAPATAGARP